MIVQMLIVLDMVCNLYVALSSTYVSDLGRILFYFATMIILPPYPHAHHTPIICYAHVPGFVCIPGGNNGGFAWVEGSTWRSPLKCPPCYCYGTEWHIQEWSVKCRRRFFRSKYLSHYLNVKLWFFKSIVPSVVGYCHCKREGVSIAIELWVTEQLFIHKCVIYLMHNLLFYASSCSKNRQCCLSL